MAFYFNFLTQMQTMKHRTTHYFKPMLCGAVAIFGTTLVCAAAYLTGECWGNANCLWVMILVIFMMEQI